MSEIVIDNQLFMKLATRLPSGLTDPQTLDYAGIWRTMWKLTRVCCASQNTTLWNCTGL